MMMMMMMMMLTFVLAYLKNYKYFFHDFDWRVNFKKSWKNDKNH